MDKDPNNHFLTFPGNPCPHSRQGGPRVQVPHLHHEVLNRSLDMDPRPGLFLYLLVHRYPQDPRRVPTGPPWEPRNTRVPMGPISRPN